MERHQYTTRLGKLKDFKLDEPPAFTGAEALSVMWRLCQDAWTFKEGASAEFRLQRHIARLERRKS